MKLANFFKIFDFIRMVLQLMFLLIAFHFRKKKFQNYKIAIKILEMLKIKNTLTKETKYLLIVGMLFLAGSNIASVFLNVYLVRLTNSIFIILFQNILNYVSLLIAFIIGTKFISKINLVTFLKTGIFSMIAYYLLILSLKEQAQLFLIP